MDKVLEDKIFVDGIEYRYVKLRGRGKYIARDGSIINPLRRNQKATIHINADGYPCCGGGIPIHMYVAYAWVDGYFDGAEVNHKDFDRMNYNADNLEWVTHGDNVRYSVDNNPLWSECKQGVRNGRAKFTVEQVLRIRKLYDNGMSVADIIRDIFGADGMEHAKDYRNIHSNVTNICKRITWKCIPEQ